MLIYIYEIYAEEDESSSPPGSFDILSSHIEILNIGICDAEDQVAFKGPGQRLLSLTSEEKIRKRPSPSTSRLGSKIGAPPKQP